MSPARALIWIERHLPRLAPRLKKWFVEYALAFNRQMGIRIERAAPDSSEVVLRLLDRRRNRNVGGTIHGGVMLALAESVHGVAVLWQFPPADHRMVSRESRIEFLAPARGELTTRFGLDRATCERIGKQLDATGSCEIELQSIVRDAAGREVARLTARYHIRRRSAAGARAGD